MKNRIKLTTCLVLSICLFFSIKAQTFMTLKEKNGTVQYFDIHNLKSIVFHSGNTVIRDFDNSILTYPNSALRSFSFSKTISTSISDNLNASSGNLIASPDPVTESLHLFFQSGVEGKCLITIFTLDGKNVIRTHLNSTYGENNHTIQNVNLKCGGYIVLLQNKNESLFSKFVINKH